MPTVVAVVAPPPLLLDQRKQLEDVLPRIHEVRWLGGSLLSYVVSLVSSPGSGDQYGCQALLDHLVSGAGHGTPVRLYAVSQPVKKGISQG